MSETSFDELKANHEEHWREAKRKANIEQGLPPDELGEYAEHSIDDDRSFYKIGAEPEKDSLVKTEDVTKDEE